MTPRLGWTVCESPLGALTLWGGPRGLAALDFGGRGGRPQRAPEDLAEAVEQLQAYFAGRRRDFTVALDLDGTPFQQRVWRRLLTIPYGTTVSYAELAQRVGHPGGARAVGAAVARTPVPVIVPCHRVRAGDGALRGYRGGLERKRALLDLERRVAAAEHPAAAPV